MVVTRFAENVGQCGQKCINLRLSAHERRQETQNIRPDVVENNPAFQRARGDLGRDRFGQRDPDHQSGASDIRYYVGSFEQNPELRATAVQQLGVMGAHDELWSLYQKESTVDVKKQIIRALFTGGNVTRLAELARSEKNGELRLLAVRNLGVMGSKRTGDVLVEIYNTDKDPEIRKAVINGLFVSGNAEGLVALARKENDPAMKKEIVSRLSNMRSKVATDYLLELLNK